MENSDCGLGIGIESIVQDEELIDGNQYHHYIVEINSEGPIGRDGTLSVGDEILEDHLELARIFHTTPTKGFLVCARFPNETYSGDIKTESGSDEMIVTNAIPFNHSLSDGEVPSVDFEEQIFDKHSSNGLYSESKENSMHEIINVNETDQNYSSDIDDSQQPIRLLTITSTGLNTSSLELEMENGDERGAQIGAQAADYAAARYNHTTEALSLNESEPNAYSESSLRPSFAAVSKSNLFIYSGITTLKINPSLHTVRSVGVLPPCVCYSPSPRVSSFFF
ncbi:unnamed protein product [Trichobilharzia regenti]|nr:unnamed protein product [Trichobilharzia regenti]